MCASDSVCSLSSLKKIRLPGLAYPVKVRIIFLLHMYHLIPEFTYYQHYSPRGHPFYVNSIKGIIKCCIGTPDIAQSVARFPIAPKKEMR